MKKYLLITADFPPIIGGIAAYLYNIWRYFTPLEATILAPAAPGAQEFDRQQNLRILRRRFPLGDSGLERISKTALFILYLFPLLLRERPKLLCCGHPISVGFAALLYKIIFKIPYCIFVYGGEPVKYQQNKIMNRLMSATLNSADGIIAISAYTKNEYRLYGPKHGFLEALNAGIDVDKFSPDIDSTNLRDRLGLQGKKVLLTVSRLVERKNQSLIIDILPQLLQRIPNLVYIIVGTGPTQAGLKAQVRRLKLEPYVIFTGGLANEVLPQYYSLCDLHVMVSRKIEAFGDVEGFGISFIEASACGKPVIGGNTGGMGDAIADGVTGFRVDPQDRNQVIQAVLKVLQDEACAKKMGQAGRRLVLAKFSSQAVAEKCRRLLEQI